jgi:hypothetical protein
VGYVQNGVLGIGWKGVIILKLEEIEGDLMPRLMPSPKINREYAYKIPMHTRYHLLGGQSHILFRLEINSSLI